MNVEIFDVETEQVIKKVPKTEAIQEEAKKIIKQIDDIYKDINPVPNTGYMIKIPLDPQLKIENEWLNSEIDVVIIIIPDDEEPYLITFDQENKPHVFLFESEVDGLLNELDLRFE